MSAQLLKGYTIIPALYKRPGEREPEWVCTCPGRPKRQRHTDPRGCLPAADVAAWRQRNPEAKCSDATARVLLWLEREFSTPRERVDDRGMTAMQSMMFDRP